MFIYIQAKGAGTFQKRLARKTKRKWELAFQFPYPDHVENFSWGIGPHFVVGRNMILSRPRDEYEKMFRFASGGGNYTDSQLARTQGHFGAGAWFMEFLWNVIFNEENSTSHPESNTSLRCKLGWCKDTHCNQGRWRFNKAFGKRVREVLWGGCEEDVDCTQLTHTERKVESTQTFPPKTLRSPALAIFSKRIWSFQSFLQISSTACLAAVPRYYHNPQTGETRWEPPPAPPRGRHPRRSRRRASPRLAQWDWKAAPAGLAALQWIDFREHLQKLQETHDLKSMKCQGFW